MWRTQYLPRCLYTLEQHAVFLYFIGNNDMNDARLCCDLSRSGHVQLLKMIVFEGGGVLVIAELGSSHEPGQQLHSEEMRLRYDSVA